MENDGILNEDQFISKELVGLNLKILGQSKEEEYDYQGKIESVSRTINSPFLVFEVSNFCHRRGRNDDWHKQSDRNTIRIKIPENGKFLEVSKNAYFLFYSQESSRPDDIRIFIVQ